MADARIAVLIDADNASAASVEQVLSEVAELGRATVRRAYGNWSGSHLKPWAQQLHVHAIQPIQQFALTKGKNASDIALVIDAMDLLHRGVVDGFALVSSDSDLTPLVIRIRQEGMEVYGFGDERAPGPFVSACSDFILVGKPAKKATATSAATPAPKSAKKTAAASAVGSAPKSTAKRVAAQDQRPAKKSAAKPATKSSGSAHRSTPSELRADTELVTRIRSAIAATCDDTGWAPLSEVGNHLATHAPVFDPRSRGYAQLSGITKALGVFESRRGKGNVSYIRDKKPA
jgi:hypothetical protein